MDGAFWSPHKGLAVAMLLEIQLLSALTRRRGNSTGAACGLGCLGEGSTSGGAPGGLAPLPLSCSPEACGTWTGCNVSARLEEDGDGSLQEGKRGKGLEEEDGRRSHSTREH